jgi:hypothetical protein
MSLARDLLKKKHIPVVLEYFKLCARLWKLGNKGTLAEWAAAAENGEIPDFLFNLIT